MHSLPRPSSVETGENPYVGFSLQTMLAPRLIACALLLAGATSGAVGHSAWEALDDDHAAKREARLVSTYEDRLHGLEAEVERLRTSEAVQRARLARRASMLERRSEWLAGKDVAGAVEEARGALRLGEEAKSTDVLAAVETSLREAERRQLGDVRKLSVRLAVRTLKLTKVLQMHGIRPPDTAQGGPMIALKGAVAFDERMAAFEAAQARYDAIVQKARGLPRGSPVPGRKVSSRFGSRRDPLNGRQALHGGLDFKAPKGERVRATARGTVRFAGRRGGYGKLVIIDHGNGLTTRYGHLSRIEVEKGERVKRGAIIGRVGSTGRSTGPHLHYEVRRGGQVRDPAHYVRLGRVLKPLM